MISLRQNITSIDKLTLLGKLLAQLCLDARFLILKSIQSHGDHVMKDAKCVVERLQLRKEKEIAWIRDQSW